MLSACPQCSQSLLLPSQNKRKGRLGSSLKRSESACEFLRNTLPHLSLHDCNTRVRSPQVDANDLVSHTSGGGNAVARMGRTSDVHLWKPQKGNCQRTEKPRIPEASEVITQDRPLKQKSTRVMSPRKTRQRSQPVNSLQQNRWSCRSVPRGFCRIATVRTLRDATFWMVSFSVRVSLLAGSSRP